MNLSESKILITGATGSLGRQLVYEFARRGIQPICHVRESSDTSYLDSLKLEKRVADLRNKDQLRQLVAGMDGIIHTAAWVDFRCDRLTQFTGINTFGALELFKAAQESGVKRFLHLSTIAAVGASRRELNKAEEQENKDSVWLNEDSPFNLDHLHIPYIMTKRAAEVELGKAASQGSTELVIVNPSIIIAPSRTGDNREAAIRRFFKSIIMPDLPNTINLVDIRDLAPGILSALEKGENGHRYILGGDNISGRDLLLTVSVILGKMPHLLRFPRWSYSLVARCSLVRFHLVGKSTVSFYPDLMRLLDYDWRYSSRKAFEALDYRSRSIHATMNDLLNNNFFGTWQHPKE